MKNGGRQEKKGKKREVRRISLYCPRDGSQCWINLMSAVSRREYDPVTNTWQVWSLTGRTVTGNSLRKDELKWFSDSDSAHVTFILPCSLVAGREVYGVCYCWLLSYANTHTHTHLHTHFWTTCLLLALQMFRICHADVQSAGQGQARALAWRSPYRMCSAPWTPCSHMPSVKTHTTSLLL